MGALGQAPGLPLLASPERHSDAETGDILRCCIGNGVKISCAQTSAAVGCPKLQTEGHVFHKPDVGPTPDVDATRPAANGGVVKKGKPPVTKGSNRFLFVPGKP